MSRLVSRILLSIFMFPLAGIFYTAVFIIADEHLRLYGRQETTLFLFSGILTWLLVAIYWCLLWRASVNWNSSRITRTLLAALAAALVGVLSGALTGAAVDSSFAAFIGGVLSILLWLIATVFIWRETAAERAEQLKSAGKSAVSCPTCGYNLTGLSESRCPECGSKFTLDQLLALQLKTDKDIE